MQGQEKLTLTVADVARHLNISKALAYNIVESEGFPSLKVGKRRIVIPADQFMTWLKSQAGKSNKGR